MAFNKPCLDCGTLSRASRCPEHTAQRNATTNRLRDNDPARKEKKRLLYDSHYRKQAKWVRDTATTCHLCGKGTNPNDPWEADHVDAGNTSSQLLAAHRSCNQSRGNKALPK